MFEALPLVVEAPGELSTLFAAADVAAKQWDLPQPSLIRIGANAVFACEGTILRIGRATTSMERALRFAERLAATGIRVAMPARRGSIELDNGLSVTAWQRIEADPNAAVDWRIVGEMVARVHAIDPATVDHPLPFCGDLPWWDVDAMMSEVDADVVDDVARTGMRQCLDAHGWWVEACRSEPMSLCHGDVHPGNVLVDSGGPVLIDWDLLCVGPAEWDHAALSRWTDRWGGDPGIYEAFDAGYSAVAADRVDTVVCAAIAEMRLLVATLMRLRWARADPAHASEATSRLAYWRGDPDAPVWLAQ